MIKSMQDLKVTGCLYKKKANTDSSNGDEDR